MSVIKNECKNFPYISLGTSTDLKQLIQQEILLVFIHKNQKVHLSEELNLFIEKILLTYQNNWFEGKTITFYATLKTGLQRVVLVGLPDKKDLSSNVLRKLTGNAARVIAELPETSIGIYCDYLFDATKEDYLSAILEGMLLGAYTFTELKSQQKEVQFKELLILSKIEKCADLLKEAYILSSNIAWSRNLINRPGNLVKPETLAEEAVAIAAEYDLSIEVLAEKELEAKGMGAILAVGQGSAAESKMITIKYEG
ncbi:MAG TPA: hypothetical protein IAB06_05590, partial [Candidatus Avacidaminococcus intestinavium]|nr:hypothetical protein [Candidatus Avacidaminococcus intestinavium]